MARRLFLPAPERIDVEVSEAGGFGDTRAAAAAENERNGAGKVAAVADGNVDRRDAGARPQGRAARLPAVDQGRPIAHGAADGAVAAGEDALRAADGGKVEQQAEVA